MKLPIAKIIERRDTYSEVLEQWVEIAVFDEAYLRETIISQLDLTDMEIDGYRWELLKKWPGLDYSTRLKMSVDPAAVTEVYEMIVQANPSLHPRNVVQIQGISDILTGEYKGIGQWFSSHGEEGTRPQVIDGTQA